MSVDAALAAQLGSSPVKRSKSHKRKHAAVSESPAQDLAASHPSPTKKMKRSKASSEAISASDTHPPSANTLYDSTASDRSAFCARTLSLYLPLAPIALQTPIPGLCAEHLSPLLLTYYPPLKGVVLSYSNPRLSQHPDEKSSVVETFAVSIAEYGASYVWLTADFLVLSPKSGIPFKGYVNLQSETHVGLVCWNLFSATISKSRLPSDWQWIVPGGNRQRQSGKRKKDKLRDSADIEEEAMDVDEPQDAAVLEDNAEEEAEEEDEEEHGHWADGNGAKIDGELDFRIVGMDAAGGLDQSTNFVSIKGTLLGSEEEKAIIQQEEEEWERKQAKKRGGKKTQQAYTMSGAKSSSRKEVDAAAMGNANEVTPREAAATENGTKRKGKKSKS